jgi:poly-gamma-glutamate synthesis protein (capsule biosynthesis protein)
MGIGFVQSFGANEPGQRSFLFFGDFAPNLSGPWQRFASAPELLEPFQQAAEESEACFFNLETVITDAELPLARKPATNLVCDPEVLKLLGTQAHWVACLANNHIMDAGPLGLQHTRKALAQHKIPAIGAGCRPEEIYAPWCSQSGSGVTVINVAEGEEANEIFNDGQGAAHLENLQLTRLIGEAKQSNQFVIIVCHGGMEFCPVPPPSFQRICRTFIDIGADCVVGHHPHAVGGYEYYRSKPIVYSLGNFLVFRPRGRDVEKLGYALRVSLRENMPDAIDLMPFEITSSGIESLSDKSFERAVQQQQTVNAVLSDPHLTRKCWQAFAVRHNPMIDIGRIAKAHFIDPLLARTEAFRLVSQFSQRDLYCPASRAEGDESIEIKALLDQYGVQRSLKGLDRAFLMLGGKFRAVAHVLSTIKTALKKAIRGSRR